MQWVSVDDISGIGPPTFGTIGKITDAILLSPSVPESYDYDTKLIASRVEEAFKISKRMDGRGTGLSRLSSTESAASNSKTLHPER